MVAGATGPAELAPVFTDHMVLQRDQPLPFWGTAPPGGGITVTLGGVRVAARAAETGRWFLTLPPQPANADPQTVTVALDGTLQTTLRDVLIGEVWLCAGQSNMEFRCRQESSWAAEQQTAGRPLLRLLNMRYAGQGISSAPYPAAVRERQNPADFYTPGTWSASTAATAGDFSAVAWFFGKDLGNALGVPVGLIHCAVGGSPAEAWIRRDALAASPVSASFTSGNWLTDPGLEPWCQARARVQLGSAAAADSPDGSGPDHPFKPSFLWDAGPGRIAPFAIRGVLWYQGESNALSHAGESGVSDPAWRVRQHESLFPLLVNDWRAQWGQGDFPFLLCQLSSIRETSYASHYWPEFRDQQRRAVGTLPNLGIAVTSDIGDPGNVHPANKHDVGKRLSAWARRYVYGDAAALPCPLPDNPERVAAGVRVTFRHAGTGLATRDGGVPASFELAGSDGIFHPAVARLDGDAVQVASPDVPDPRSIRYGWQPFTDGNLINSAGLPASTFQGSVAP